MKPDECRRGVPVTTCGISTIDNTMNIIHPIKLEGIISGLREEITFEKGRKQYTMEFGKRKAIYPQIKIVSRYATVILTDGRIIDVNIEDLTAKSCGGP